MNGDLDATVLSDTGYYYLRDFATTGDAIRIKLPYIDPSKEFPEYIWIENHNGKNMNGVEFDQWQYQDAACVTPLVYGLYMYLQIDKDVRQSASLNDVNGGHANYLRPITAEGFYDREYDTTLQKLACVGSYDVRPFIRPPDKQNPLTGCGDQEWYMVDGNNNNLLEAYDGLGNDIENVEGNYESHLFWNGHSRHAFTLSGNKKLGIGTNPSSASMMNMVGKDWPPPADAKNLRKVYLNGISVEITEQFSDGGIVVRIRFDDIDVANDVRWCADSIVLNPVKTSSGYSLNLKKGKTITIDQGLTGTRMNNPQIINGNKVFASPTVFTCLANSYFHLESKAKVILDNESKLFLKPGSKLEIEKGARLVLQKGSSLVVEEGAQLIIRKGGKVIKKK